MEKNVRYLLMQMYLTGVQPPVRRMVCVPDILRLDRLHRVIQTVFSWNDTALHEFLTPAGDFGPDPIEDEILPEMKYTVRHLFSPGYDRFSYIYDLEENYLHEIRITDFDYKNESGQAVFCVAGDGVNPFDDTDDFCSGIDFTCWPPAWDLRSLNSLLRKQFRSELRGN